MTILSMGNFDKGSGLLHADQDSLAGAELLDMAGKAQGHWGPPLPRWAKPPEPHSLSFLLPPLRALSPGWLSPHRANQPNKKLFFTLSVPRGGIWDPGGGHHLLVLHCQSGQWQECE